MRFSGPSSSFANLKFCVYADHRRSGIKKRTRVRQSKRNEAKHDLYERLQKAYSDLHATCELAAI